MKVSANGRYLETDDGQPFFYLADTSWSLFYQTEQDAARYLRNRKEKGFTVVQPCCVFEVYREEGLFVRNFEGEAAFLGDTLKEPNPRFFAHVDRIVDIAEELGLVVAMLPSWASFIISAKWRPSNLLFDRQTAKAYGRFIGARYGDKPVIWVTGGDRCPENDEQIAVLRAMVDGIKETDGGGHLMTYHPSTRPALSSSRWFHNEPWLDYNMMQTSTKWWDTYAFILHDYNLQPAKPVVDGETRYEHSHRDFGKKTGPRMLPRHVRQAAYNAMLSGALGHTYGCRDVWSFHVPGDEEPKRDVDTHWQDAMDFPGAFHMGHLKRLFTDYPWHRLVPDQQHELVSKQTITYAQLDRTDIAEVASGASTESMTYIPAARAADGTFAVVYTPVRQSFAVDFGRIDAERAKARWFNPRAGEYVDAGEYPAAGEIEFTPPADEEDADYALVVQGV
ncbi:MAG: glycoside hydrolase family 140 protein [Kiritimatiellae bacterium]|nr:glycoside hydrolase family 140 protein [Kiritimatiellia bacterium]